MKQPELVRESIGGIVPKLEVGAALVVSALATPALLGYGIVRDVEQNIRNSKELSKVVDEANMFIDGPLKALKTGFQRGTNDSS